MRPSHFPLLLALIVVPKLGLAATLANAESTDSMPQLQGLVESEFAFQSGAFEQAFSYYKKRPVAALSESELTRSAQFAIAAGDFAWLKNLLSLAAVQASKQQELLALRLALALRQEQAQEAQTIWQALLLSKAGAGNLLSREIVFRHAEDDQSTVSLALELYAKQKLLSDAEVFELLQISAQLQMPELAKSLKNRLQAGSKELALAQAIEVCNGVMPAKCSQLLEQLKPADYDEYQQRRVFELARRSDNSLQAMRWLLALPQDGNTYYQRIILLSQSVDQLKNNQLATDIVSDIKLSSFQQAVLLGSLAELSKDWLAAEGFYQEALSLNTPTIAAIRLAHVLFKQNKTDQAFSWLLKIQNDSNFSEEIRREAFLTEIQFYRFKSDDPEGLHKAAVYQRALKLWPLAHRIRYQYAMYFFEKNLPKEGLKQLQEILKFSPADANALNTYGYILAKDFNRPRVAYKPIEQAYLLSPNRAEILDSYGYVLHRLGRNTEALPPLQKAWKLTPSAVTAGHLAQVYWQLGDKEQANDYLQKGLNLDKNELELLEFKERLP
ncbi:MAG: hypothetical protein KA365_06420 [Arenimonas sp.]|nr:hypothetical protein [Arenimonas sp.]MBP6310185.1 hypothetical protein [Arenimonas sp.]